VISSVGRVPPPRRQRRPGIRQAIGRDLGVDLGTANTVIVARGRGVVLTQPSFVAVDTQDQTYIAMGAEAKEMLGRVPPTIEVIRPMRGGVISDFDATQAMLRDFLQRVHRRKRLVKPRVIVCVPSGVTSVEQRAVEEAVIEVGARKAVIVAEPLAAAVGAGLPVEGTRGCMVVDVGGGTTEVAVFVRGAIVVGRSTRVGGDDLDLAVQAHLRKHHGLQVGERTAERIKCVLGSAARRPEPMVGEVVGRDVVDGRPRRAAVSDEDLREGMSEPVHAIVDGVRAVFELMPPELTRDVLATGIVLTGGTALLAGLAERIGEETGVEVRVDAEPLSCVARGAGELLERL